MRRGDIWIVSFDPATGSESNSVRPAIIVSNDGANAAALNSSGGVITVVPLTSNVQRVLSFQTLLEVEESGLRAPSKVQAEQVRAVSVRRLQRHVGRVSASVMVRVDEALRRHLAL